MFRPLYHLVFDHFTFEEGASGCLALAIAALPNDSPSTVRCQRLSPTKTPQECIYSLPCIYTILQLCSGRMLRPELAVLRLYEGMPLC